MPTNPKSIKDLKSGGTYRPDRHANRLESRAEPLTKIPAAPSHFDERKKQKWVQTCETLLGLGTLTAADVDVVAQYCEAFFLCADSMAALSKDGHILEVTTAAGITKPVINPAWRQWVDAQKVVQALGDRLGLNPKARMSIKTDPAPEKEDPLSFIFNN